MLVGKRRGHAVDKAAFDVAVVLIVVGEPGQGARKSPRESGVPGGLSPQVPAYAAAERGQGGKLNLRRYPLLDVAALLE
jgi:hypothetical protein